MSVSVSDFECVSVYVSESVSACACECECLPLSLPKACKPVRVVAGWRWERAAFQWSAASCAAGKIYQTNAQDREIKKEVKRGEEDRRGRGRMRGR